MSDDLPLGAEFPAATREKWLKLVDGVLKGAPFDKKLISWTYDGLRIEPLYARAAAAMPVAGRTPGTAWTLMQRVDHTDPAAANAQALEDLENGANGLTLVFAGSVSANGYGLDAAPAALARVLEGVALETGITIDFNLSPATRDAVRHFAGLVKSRGLAPGSVDLRASINPIGGFAASGASPRPWAALAQDFTAMVRELAAQGFGGPIASAVAYLRALASTGMSLDAARGMIYFRLSADADQFLTMAKFRALRKLWARVEEACGLAPKPAYVAAESAWRMLTRRDPNVNMLRITMAVAAAGLGGADSITALPHTAALGLPDAFARRIARNTQLILLEESNLAKVADPAAGSGAIEDITGSLCVAAWSLFQEIEAAGGAWAALERGLIQGKVAAVRAQRQQAVAQRKDALTGTSDFPDLHESQPAVLDVARIVAPKESAVALTIEALPRIRLADPFEGLRDASDRMLAERGARPKVFLANLGRPSDFTARATFAKNFFEAGGIEAVTNDGFKSRDEMVVAFKASGAKLVCLCGSDEIYAKEAVAAAQALAGAAHLYLAGRPRELESELEAAGVGTFIFAGCDVLSTLGAAHEILRAKA